MPEIREVSFDTGLVTLNLNKTIGVTFNPTDTNFLDRLFKSFELLESLGKEHEEEVKKAENRNVFEVDRKYDAEMRKCINSTFEKDICDALFGTMNVFSSLAKGGPVWFNLMEVVLDTVKERFAEEQEAVDPRIEKFVQKYRKKK